MDTDKEGEEKDKKNNKKTRKLIPVKIELHILLQDLESTGTLKEKKT